VPALRDVSMEIRRGEIVCLLGGNASGKSTTMKTVIGSVASDLPSPDRAREPDDGRLYSE
jgi:ABC-type multidrug transport system ATPase subunit